MGIDSTASGASAACPPPTWWRGGGSVGVACAAGVTGVLGDGGAECVGVDGSDISKEGQGGKIMLFYTVFNFQFLYTY